MKIYKSLVILLFTSLFFSLKAQNLSTEYIIAFEKISLEEKTVNPDHRVQIERLLNDPNVLSITTGSPKLNLYHLKTRQELSSKDIKKWKEKGFLKYCFKNSIVKERDTEPNDPLYSEQWNLDKIQVADVWKNMRGGTNSYGDNIVLAVIDSDFDINHADLNGNIYNNSREVLGLPGVDDDNNGYIDDVRGYDFRLNTAEIVPYNSSHGTSVAGVIGAQTDNEIGLAGMNWWTKVLPLRVYLFSDYLEALSYCYDLRKKYNDTNGEQGAYLVAQNTSLGYPIDEDALGVLEELADDLGSVGILSVLAAPNEDMDIDQEVDLAGNTSDYVISVGSTNIYDNKVSGSGFGQQNLDLAAPGGDSNGLIDLLYNYNEVGQNGGTSFATPLVTGTVGLLYNQADSSLDKLAKIAPNEAALLIKSCILNGTDPVDDFINKSTTEGRLNSFKSLLCLHQHFQTLSLDPAYNYTKKFEIFEIFPNPSLAEQEIKIIFAQDNFNTLQYKIYDLVGKEIKQGNIPVIPLTENKASINIRPNLSSGIYTLVLSSAEMSVSEKIIIH